VIVLAARRAALRRGRYLLGEAVSQLAGNALRNVKVCRRRWLVQSTGSQKCPGPVAHRAGPVRTRVFPGARRHRRSVNQEVTGGLLDKRSPGS